MFNAADYVVMTSHL